MKRMISLMLVLALVLGVCPAAFAAEAVEEKMLQDIPEMYEGDIPQEIMDRYSGAISAYRSFDDKWGFVHTSGKEHTIFANCDIPFTLGPVPPGRFNRRQCRGMTAAKANYFLHGLPLVPEIINGLVARLRPAPAHPFLERFPALLAPLHVLFLIIALQGVPVVELENVFVSAPHRDANLDAPATAHIRVNSD